AAHGARVAVARPPDGWDPPSRPASTGSRMDNPVLPDFGWAAFAGGTLLVLVLWIALVLLGIWIGYTLLWRAIRRGILTANGTGLARHVICVGYRLLWRAIGRGIRTANGTWPPGKGVARHGAGAMHDGPPTGPRDWQP